jgi:hypothetical protein
MYSKLEVQVRGRLSYHLRSFAAYRSAAATNDVPGEVKGMVQVKAGPLVPVANRNMAWDEYGIQKAPYSFG